MCPIIRSGLSTGQAWQGPPPFLGFGFGTTTLATDQPRGQPIRPLSTGNHLFITHFISRARARQPLNVESFNAAKKKTVSNRTALPQLVDENLSTAEDKKLPLVPTNPCDCVCLCDCVCKCENFKGMTRASARQPQLNVANWKIRTICHLPLENGLFSQQHKVQNAEIWSMTCFLRLRLVSVDARAVEEEVQYPGWTCCHRWLVPASWWVAKICHSRAP